MKEKAIGFYWTLPVPWAGFTDIESKDVAEAARQSRTVALQRDVIQRWAKENGVELIHEEVFLEREPDRGSEGVKEPLTKLLKLAREQNAQILYFDFARATKSRHHFALQHFVEENSEHFLDIDPSGEEVVFARHFSEWRERQRAWIEGKNARVANARQRGSELREEGLSFAAAADQLNVEGVSSPSGKYWTGENLRKLLGNS